MEVAILYSGGKDSTLAIEYAVRKNWDIKYLISVKPTRRDCYLFHYSTVELTKHIAKILGIKQVYVTCSEADPKKEAEIIKKIVEKNPVEAVLLGGIGLQETQIKSVREALFSLGTEVFATHVGSDHVKLMQEMISNGYDIRISEVAADGLSSSWLGERLTKENINEFVSLAKKYGFHPGGEGGPYNTIVLDSPIFPQRLEIVSFEKVMDEKFSGYIDVKEVKVIDKFLMPKIR
ncbi:diphthine--ammonia ligase [Candidatus Woesearchaeota archaeon]|nr:diphthine--ammonia ligase [Candidatus Woesearchaeota archaeon]